MSTRVTIGLVTVAATQLWVFTNRATAVPANPNPIVKAQPDGTEITLRVRGDEYFHWLEDLNGFTVVRNQGAFEYATLDAAGELSPSGLLVGRADPRAEGLAPRILPSAEARAQLRDARKATPELRDGPPLTVPPSGTVKNLVVLCKFSDHTYGSHTRAQADYDVLFNSVGGDPTLAPTGSVKDCYTENSYGMMTLESTVVAWVTLPHPQAYYANGASGLTVNYPSNAQGMVKDALDLVDPLVDFGPFDTDNDGYIDAIDIIHSGYGAEFDGDPDKIWSHRWNLSQVSSLGWISSDTNGAGANVKVYDYHTEPALWGTSGTDICRIGVIAHETGHFFGLSDLYDTDYSSTGVGSWAMMANSWGFDGSQQYPPHFCAYSKIALGWVTPVMVDSPDRYIAPQVESQPTVYRIDTGYPAGEYLLIENRQPVGLDALIPQGGLCVWHVDEAKPDNDDEGYPGQADGWPGNNRHYRVALLQADGRFDLEKGVNSGDSGDVYHAAGVSVLGAFTVPDTNAYQGGAVLVTGNSISASAAGGYMYFDFGIDPCLSGTDCNGNGLSDVCDIAGGTSNDLDGNDVPDECFTIHNITQDISYGSIQEAIDASVSGDEIEVGPGTYVERIDLLGKAITLRSTYGPAATIIDGDAVGSVITCQGGEGLDTVIQGFTVTNGNADTGGGMYSHLSSPTLTNCAFAGNSANDDGGGMYLYESSPTLINCTFTNNSSGSDGGGVCSYYNSSPTLANCTFSDNWAGLRGGGIYSYYYNNSSPTLTHCIFSGNAASYDGGGMYCSRSNATLANCTFSGNSSDSDGGGMVVSSCTVILTNCTFSGNSAYYDGGGIDFHNSNLTITNGILWGNTATTGPQVYDYSKTSTITYSCVEGGWIGEGNRDIAPMFVDADGADNVVGTLDDDLHLQASSPCINAGDDSAILQGVTTDYEGDARIQQCRVDMGADETVFVGPDCNSNGVADACDIQDEVSGDCNSNGVPDECETGGLEDCNSNGTPDLCDIVDGFSEDCDLDDVPDECEIVTDAIYVDDDATVGLNDGSSWADAYSSLADALFHAECSGSVTEIRVAGGTYRPSVRSGGSSPRYETFSLVSGVKIRGGYSGLFGGSDPDERDISLYETILSGDIGVEEDNSDNSYHVVTGSGTDATAVLDGCIITGGRADESGELERGGGMYSVGGSPSLTNCTFVGNSARFFGGGMYNGPNSNPTLTTCAFRGNSATSHGDGGGIYNDLNSNPLLISCILSGNSASDDGGGVFNGSNSNPTFIACAFIGNSAIDEGGGMFNASSTVMLANCIFHSNSSTNGGGVYSYLDRSPTFTNCILWGNTGGTAPQIYGSATATHSCVEGDWDGAGNIAADPQLVRAPYDGGDGWGDDPATAAVDEGANDDFGILRLRAGSPCIDAGDNSAVPADVLDLDGDSDTAEPVPFDLNGLPRFYDDPFTVDTGVGTAPIVDMGAYEYQPGTGDCDEDGDVDLDDLADFIGCAAGPEAGVGGPCLCGDLNGDGDVDLHDFAGFQAALVEP